jgi:ribulose-5-phosphate 4-epimerase/fuculose-1-phosphate aldolase
MNAPTSAAAIAPVGGIDPAEWALRVELAAAYRIADHLGWSELIYTHISLRVPGSEHHFLINPYGLRFDEVTASNLVKIDADGRTVGAGEYKANEAGFVIHSAVHLARADAQCVFHTHTLAGMAVSAQAGGLLPIHMYSHNFYGRVAYHDFEGPSMNLGERERLVASLGSQPALILRNHGLLTVGRTVPEAFIRMWRLERACQVQIAAQAGGHLHVPSREVCEQSAAMGDDFLTDRGAQPLGQLEFDALVRVIDRKDSSYKD